MADRKSGIDPESGAHVLHAEEVAYIRERLPHPALLTSVALGFRSEGRLMELRLRPDQAAWLLEQLLRIRDDPGFGAPREPRQF